MKTITAWKKPDFWILLFLLIIFFLVIRLNVKADENVEMEQLIELLPIIQTDGNRMSLDYYEEHAAEIEQKQLECAEKFKLLEKIEDNKDRYMKFRELVNEYYEYCDPPETIYDYFTEEEINLICRMVETEVYGADFDAKCNVASVLFNRYDDERWSNDITTLITSPGQFAYGRKKISDDTMLAVEYVWIFGSTVEDATYFHSMSDNGSFNGATLVLEDHVGHKFFRK